MKYRRVYKTSISIISSLGAGTLFASGCVSVPEKTQIVNNADSSHAEATSCDIRQAQHYSTGKLAPKQELDPNNISLLNWNIYKGQRKNWARDFRELSDGQDLVIIQEAQLNPEIKDTLKEKSINWTLNTGFYLYDEPTGVLTGSRVKPISSCGLRTTEPFLRLPKTMLVNKYKLSGSDETLLVANIHSINFTLGTESYRKQIESLTSAITSHQGPVIVAGDFNSWSEKRRRIIDDMIDRLSLKAVTYNSHNRITVFGHAIDHVFYRGLETVSSESHQVTSSDHNPIRVTFRKLPEPHQLASAFY